MEDTNGNCKLLKQGKSENRCSCRCDVYAVYVTNRDVLEEVVVPFGFILAFGTVTRASFNLQL